MTVCVYPIHSLSQDETLWLLYVHSRSSNCKAVKIRFSLRIAVFATMPPCHAPLAALEDWQAAVRHELLRSLSTESQKTGLFCLCKILFKERTSVPLLEYLDIYKVMRQVPMQICRSKGCRASVATTAARNLKEHRIPDPSEWNASRSAPHQQ